MSENQTKKILSYAAAGGAAVVLTPAANADLVFNGGNLAPGTVVFDTTTGLDLDGDGAMDFDITHLLNGGYYGFGYAAGLIYALGNNQVYGSNPSYYYINRLGASFSVSANIGGGSNQWQSYGFLNDGSGFANSDFLAGTTGHFGVEFGIGEDTHYGFVEIYISDEVHPDNPLQTSNAITVLGYAYQSDAGKAAHIPGPGALGLLALGASGMAGRRRKRA